MPRYAGSNYRKLDNFKDLLERGCKCIITTHSLFLAADMEVVNLIKSRDYNLIIDEAISCVSLVSSGARRCEYEDFDKLDDALILTNDEIEWLRSNKMIEVGHGNIVKWIGKPSEYHKYLRIENLCEVGGLIFVNNTILVWRFPPMILKSFKTVKILTYQFEKSALNAYFRAYKIEYELRGLEKSGDAYIFAEYNPKGENRHKYLDLINLCNDKMLNSIGEKCGKENPLSAGWYKKANKKKELLKKLRHNTINYLRHKVSASRDTVMWSAFKKYENNLSPDGFKTIDESQKIPTFVACNARASNDYIRRYNLVYLCNTFINPNITEFFRQRGISIDESGYAQNELLQWLFRSRLREMKPINLYLPSERMRKILIEWAA